MTQAVAQSVDTLSFTDLVAEELRAHMARKRISGRELARRLRVSNQWISQRTRGVVALNTAEMEAVASALTITVPDLLQGAIARAAQHPLTQGVTEPTICGYPVPSHATDEESSQVAGSPARYLSVVGGYGSSVSSDGARGSAAVVQMDAASGGNCANAA